MVTSLVEVGTILSHQLPAVFQSELIAPVHLPGIQVFPTYKMPESVVPK